MEYFFDEDDIVGSALHCQDVDFILSGVRISFEVTVALSFVFLLNSEVNMSIIDLGYLFGLSAFHF